MSDVLLLDSLNLAINSLETALNQPKNEFIRDSVVQRFEFTYEIAWKTLKKFLQYYNGIEETGVREIFRQGAKLGYLKNLENWFEFHTARNLTSHTYSENTAEQVYSVSFIFLSEVKFLLLKLQEVLSKNA